jgi:GTP-binding protein
MIPVIALVGRPNVGKSTLFNCLTRTRDALVADIPGLTRDRQYGEGKLGEGSYIVIDTGGITGDEAGIDSAMASQSRLAIKEADIVLFLVDARAGLTAADEMLARYLRVHHPSVWLVLNKVDGVDASVAAGDFFSIGLGSPHPIAAAHGRGVTDLIQRVLAACPALKPVEPSPESDTGSSSDTQVGTTAAGGIKIAIVGRPNVGKSTLVNRLLGEERVVVYDHAGTTRDSISIPYTRQGKPYTLIDTAGIRRRGKVQESVEKFSVIKALQAIEAANVVVLVMDARSGLVEQDLHLLGFALDKGRALVIAVNKWDGLEPQQRDEIKSALQRRLVFVDFARLHFISALHGSGVGNLYSSIDEAYQAATHRWSTNQLTRMLEDAVSEHQPPLVRGRRIKLRYAHLGGVNPPLVVIHGNQTESISAGYRRYLENTFRRQLKLRGTPLRIEFKGHDNPLAEKKNTLTRRQMSKKRRLVSHVKKAEKKHRKRRR